MRVRTYEGTCQLLVTDKCVPATGAGQRRTSAAATDHVGDMRFIDTASLMIHLTCRDNAVPEVPAVRHLRGAVTCTWVESTAYLCLRTNFNHLVCPTSQDSGRPKQYNEGIVDFSNCLEHVSRLCATAETARWPAHERSLSHGRWATRGSMGFVSGTSNCQGAVR